MSGISISNDNVLSVKSISILRQRGLTKDDVSSFADLLTEIKAEKKNEGLTSLDVIHRLSKEDLSLLQKANSLASVINPSDLSEEGAFNLLSQVDGSDWVDNNNDGLVEVGAAKLIFFPPVNAPEFVKIAFEEATEGMSPRDIATLSLSLHSTIYGFHIGHESTQVPREPEKQWNQENIKTLFEKLRNNLEFRVSKEGWTEFNLMLRDFYGSFEKALITSRDKSLISSAVDVAQASVDITVSPEVKKTLHKNPGGEYYLKDMPVVDARTVD